MQVTCHKTERVNVNVIFSHTRNSDNSHSQPALKTMAKLTVSYILLHYGSIWAANTQIQHGKKMTSPHFLLLYPNYYETKNKKKEEKF